MIDQINSNENQRIKKIVRLKKSHERKKSSLFIVEGKKELNSAIKNNFEIEEIYFSPDIIKQSEVGKFINLVPVSKRLFAKISYREHPDGVLAIVKSRYDSLKSIKLSANPLVLVIEAIEKPGNLGAITRTADSVAADVVIINEKHTDIYNPNVIRASMGTVFSQKIVVADQEETYSWLKLNKITSFATTPEASKVYYSQNYKKPTAILIGAEHDGLSSYWLEKADNKILIPMDGQIDSLNASVSTAILAYEVKRQRYSH